MVLVFARSFRLPLSVHCPCFLHVEPYSKYGSTDLKDISKTYKYLIQYLCGMRGGSGVPLSCVVRASNKLHPKTSIDDPVTDYVTRDEEMVKRAPIITAGNTLGTEEDGPFDDSFVSDREKNGILYPHLSSKQRPYYTSNAPGRAVTGERKCWRSMINFWDPTTLTTFRRKQNRSSCTFYIKEK